MKEIPEIYNINILFCLAENIKYTLNDRNTFTYKIHCMNLVKLLYIYITGQVKTSFISR